MAEMNFGAQERDNSNRMQRLGNVALNVTEFDHETNSVTGITRDGELMSVRLSTKEEFADIYVNRSEHDTEDKRKGVAARQVGNRVDTKKMEDFMTPDSSGSYGTVQFQDVRQKIDGDLISRWAESLSTTPNDSYVNAQVRVTVPKSNAETSGAVVRRRADVVMPDTATEASMETLNEMTQNKVTGADGRALEGGVRSAVVVAVQDARNGSTGASFVWTPYDKDAKEFKTGGEALFNRPVNAHTWQTMVPLAAAVGKPLDDIKFDSERVSAEVRDERAPELYAETLAGNIKVAIAQGFTAEVMPRQRDAIIRSEEMARESEGRRPQISDRGFFAADVGLRSRDGQEGYSAQTSVKTILPNERLVGKTSEAYAPKGIHALGADIVANAESRGTQLTMEATPAPTPEPENKPKSGVAMSPDMSGM